MQFRLVSRVAPVSNRMPEAPLAPSAPLHAQVSKRAGEGQHQRDEATGGAHGAAPEPVKHQHRSGTRSTFGYVHTNSMAGR